MKTPTATFAVYKHETHPTSFIKSYKLFSWASKSKYQKNPNPNIWFRCRCWYDNPRKHPPPTFVVEEPLHLHRRPGVSDAEHGAGHDALLSGRAVCGPHQAPVRLVMEPLQNLHSLAPAHRQLPATAVGGHKVMDHHCQLAAAGQLKREEKIDVSTDLWKSIGSAAAGHN